MIGSINISIPANTYLVYCSSVTSSAVNKSRLLEIATPSVTLCAILFAIIYFLSRRKLTLNTSGSVESLSCRFQLKENVKSNRLLTIASLVYTVTSLTDISIVIGTSHFLKDNQLEYVSAWRANAKEFASLSMPVFINIYSLIFIFGHEYFKHRTAAMFCCHRSYFDRSDSKIAPSTTTEHHMKILGRIWENGR
ncbi:hypothetical protein Tcan_05308 [Toxocara canis]|uniref:Uncharacterized protein n=1 Tax=Toxocara canis TaxID=6265 RepID=A0A0B2VZG8_TOXCA|nr:hypothetical protein Tcan_05308 [Toxocara canis]